MKFLTSPRERQELLCDVNIRDGPAMMSKFYKWLCQDDGHKHNVARMLVCWAKLSGLFVLS